VLPKELYSGEAENFRRWRRHTGNLELLPSITLFYEDNTVSVELDDNF
jgi:hypothetical protein